MTLGSRQVHDWKDTAIATQLTPTSSAVSLTLHRQQRAMIGQPVSYLVRNDGTAGIIGLSFDDVASADMCSGGTRSHCGNLMSPLLPSRRIMVAGIQAGGLQFVG